MTTLHRTPATRLALATALALAGCGSSPPTSTLPSLTPPTQRCSAAGVAASDASALATVCLLTSQGELVLELDAVAAPLTVANFLQYVADGFYDGTVFHRVEASPLQIIQGGGVTIDASYGLSYKGSTHPPIALESGNGLSNLRGTVAMARTSAPDSATSQFFVNVADNTELDASPAVVGPNGYAVFGRVISGLGTVDAIGALPTYANEVPAPIVILYWAKRLK